MQVQSYVRNLNPALMLVNYVCAFAHCAIRFHMIPRDSTCMYVCIIRGDLKIHCLEFVGEYMHTVQ